jgi:hypothetical protein
MLSYRVLGMFLGILIAVSHDKQYSSSQCAVHYCMCDLSDFTSHMISVILVLWCVLPYTTIYQCCPAYWFSLFVPSDCGPNSPWHPLNLCDSLTTAGHQTQPFHHLSTPPPQSLVYFPRPLLSPSSSSSFYSSSSWIPHLFFLSSKLSISSIFHPSNFTPPLTSSSHSLLSLSHLTAPSHSLITQPPLTLSSHSLLSLSHHTASSHSWLFFPEGCDKIVECLVSQGSRMWINFPLSYSKLGHKHAHTHSHTQT